MTISHPQSSAAWISCFPMSIWYHHHSHCTGIEENRKISCTCWKSIHASAAQSVQAEFKSRTVTPDENRMI